MQALSLKPSTDKPVYNRLSRFLLVILGIVTIIGWYRSIIYLADWQFMVDLTSPLKTWVAFNFAFFQAVSGIPVLAAVLIREPQAPRLCAYILTLQMGVSFIADLLLVTGFQDPLFRAGLGMRIGLTVFLIVIITCTKKEKTANA